MYKTVVTKYLPKAKEMASKIEEICNEKEMDNLEFISCTICPSAKAILVFKEKEIDE